MFWTITAGGLLVAFVFALIEVPAFAKITELWLVMTMVITSMLSLAWVILLSSKYLLKRISLLLRKKDL